MLKECLFNLQYCEFLKAPTLKNISERLLLRMCSWNWERIKIVHEEFQLHIKETKENVCFISWLVSFRVRIHMQYFFDMVKYKLQTVNIP